MSPLEALAEAARSHKVPLSVEALQKAEAYIELVKSSKANVTADLDDESLYLRHLADGFPAAAYLKRLLGAEAPRIADLGSGGGFIGFAIKLAWPEAEVTLVESLQRKYDFLNLAAVKSGLKGLRVIKARAGMENVPRVFDAVVERALAPLPEALGMAAPLVKAGGLFVAYQSDPPDPASSKAGLKFVDSMTYRLPREDRDRHLAAYRRED